MLSTNLNISVMIAEVCQILVIQQKIRYKVCLKKYVLSKSVRTCYSYHLIEETALERKRRLGRERKARFRARLNEEALEKIRKKEAEKAAERRAAETPEQKEARRLSNKLYQQKRRAMETPEQAEQRKLQDLLYHKKRLESETPEQAELRKRSDVESHQKLRKRRAGEVDKNYDEVYVRIFPNGRKEIIGYVDGKDSMLQSEES